MTYVAYGEPSMYEDRAVCVASEGTRTITVTSEGTVRLWEERADQMVLANEIKDLNTKNPIGCVWIEDSDIVVVACKDLAVGIGVLDGTVFYEIETKDEAISITSLGCMFALTFPCGVIALIEGEEGTLLWRNHLRFFSSKSIPVLAACDRAVLVPKNSKRTEKDQGAMMGLVLEDGSAVLCRLDLSLCVVLHCPSSKDQFACSVSMTSQERCGTFSGIVHHVHVAIGCRSGDIYLYAKEFHEEKEDEETTRWSLRVIFSLKHWYYSSKYVGSVTCLRWSTDTRVLAAGYARRGLVVWSKDGCRLVRTIPDVRGKEEQDNAEDFQTNNNDFFRSGITMLEWGVESQRLIVLTKTSKLATVPLFRQVPCSCLGDHHVVAPVGMFLSSGHVLLVTHEGKRRKMIRPDDAYLRDNYPLRVASVSQNGERVAVAGSRGLTMWSRRSSKWIMFGSRAQEQMFTCDAMCWWNNVVVIAVVRRTTEENDDDDDESVDTEAHHELVAFPYWQLNYKDNHNIMDPVSIPSSSFPQNSGIRISCNADTIVVSSTSEIVTFTVTSHNMDNWGYKCKNRLSLTPKFVVCGAYAHISQMLSSDKLKASAARKTLWYRRGSSNRITFGSKLKLSSPLVEGQDVNLKSRRALVRRRSSSSVSSATSTDGGNVVLVDDGICSFDLKWPRQRYCAKFDSLWSFEKGNIVLRSLGSGTDLKIGRTYVHTDEWPLAMTLPTYEAYLVVPVIGNDKFDFRIRSRSCLHVVLYSLLSVCYDDDDDDEKKNHDVNDAVILLRYILDDEHDSESNVASALIHVLCRAAKSRNRDILRRVQIVLKELKCDDSCVISLDFDASLTHVPSSSKNTHKHTKEAFLKRILSVSLTKSNSLFYDTLNIAVKCLNVLKRLRFSSGSTKNKYPTLCLHHSNNLSLLVAAFSTGNVVVATETWCTLSRIELECKSTKKNCELNRSATNYVSSQIAENLMSCSRDDLSLVTMWITCFHVPSSFLLCVPTPPHYKTSEKRMLENASVIRNVYSRLNRLCCVVTQTVDDKIKLNAIVKILEFSEHLQLALLCAVALEST